MVLRRLGGCANAVPGLISCYLVEDEPLLRRLLLEVLASHSQARVLGSAGSVAEATAACRRVAPDLLVLDLNLPDGSGVAVAQAVAAEQPALKVLVLSAEASTFVCPEPLRPLLWAVIDKMEAFEQLPAEIDDLLAARA